MTDEQAKYRKGQIVTVRVLIRHDGPDYDGDVLIGRNVPGDWSTMHVPAADIVSVEQPPLVVGDEVRWLCSSSSTLTGRIIAIDEGVAWCRANSPRYGTPLTVALSDLVRA